MNHKIKISWKSVKYKISTYCQDKAWLSNFIEKSDSTIQISSFGFSNPKIRFLGGIQESKFSSTIDGLERDSNFRLIKQKWY